MLIIKIAQRNCLKKEFLENADAIDSLQYKGEVFSRSEKLISTIQMAQTDKMMNDDS